MVARVWPEAIFFFLSHFSLSVFPLLFALLAIPCDERLTIAVYGFSSKKKAAVQMGRYYLLVTVDC